MKKLIFSAAMIAATTATLFAQETTKPDNKPGAGSVGIWYGVSFVPLSQNIYVTGYATKNVEVGGSIGLASSRSSNSTFENTTVFTSGFTPLAGETEHRTTTAVTTFSIAPMVLYHFNIKSNVDLGLGGNVPISVSTSVKTTQTNITTATDYNHTETVVSKRTPVVGAGLGLLLSCKWFFYKNLAIGALANLGFNANTGNGHSTNISSYSNTGSNNPLNSSGSTETREKVGFNSQGFDMLHNFNLNLSWYFGTKKTNKTVASN